MTRQDPLGRCREKIYRGAAERRSCLIVGRRRGTELAVQVTMARKIAVADRNVSLAVGFTAGVIVSGLVFWGRWMPVLVLAAASCLGVIVVWGLRNAQNRRIDRSAREQLKRRLHRSGRKRLNQGTAAGGEPVSAVADEPDPSPEEFVVFHDFDTSRGRFDHW